MDCLDLQPFLLPVPICYGLDCLEVVLDEVQQSDRILLIDDDHSPPGGHRDPSSVGVSS